MGSATLNLVRTSYARVTVTRNPGRWIAAVGIGMLVVGAIGVALLQRRLPEAVGEADATESEPAVVSRGREG
ncbi:MAG: hypothetical protein E3J64_00590 [Anaerolineales bacterium]|nr:MAG: hypothetical protein E3J64_00590 [Anaerolineales bacterium]